jgi:4-diphosphocytidyl-2-C-methyl-D-erythritol kinase
VLSCDIPGIPTDESNLVLQAAALLRSEHKTELGARLHLKKRIPTKAGLGGASSNAAVALLGLTRLWQIDVSGEQLFDLAKAIGSDVPFFLVGGCALGTGTGARVAPMPDPPLSHLLVVTPAATVATSEAYRALSATALTTSNAETILAVSRDDPDFDDSTLWDVTEQLGNDFERVIFDREPEIERARNALLTAGARSALLAGSGSSVFGIFDGLEAQEKGLSSLETEPGWRVFPCVTMARLEYSRAMSF